MRSIWTVQKPAKPNFFAHGIFALISKQMKLASPTSAHSNGLVNSVRMRVYRACSHAAFVFESVFKKKSKNKITKSPNFRCSYLTRGIFGLISKRIKLAGPMSTHSNALFANGLVNAVRMRVYWAAFVFESVLEKLKQN